MEIMVSGTPCYQLEGKLKNIEFMLYDTKIIIPPKGYIYHMSDQYEDCFIGIESIPDAVGQYRLGTIFLRNFVVALDYDKNLIMIGENVGSSSNAILDGDVANPNQIPESSNQTLHVLLVILFLIFIGIMVYVITY